MNSQIDTVVHEAESLLRRTSHLANHDLWAEFAQGTLTLRGSLPTYFQKQVAQTVVAGLAGVNRVNNEIEVR
jgi:osmotically-inducible protein OsmY